MSKNLSICQTHDGYIWMGTFGGLVRFDGVHFRVYNSTNTDVIKVNGIFDLFEDSKHRLWMGTQESGVLCYENGIFTALTAADGLSHNYVRSITEDMSGNIWFATNKGLDCLHDGKLIPAKQLSMPITDRVNFVLGAKSDTIWVGTSNEGVYGYTLKQIKNGVEGSICEHYTVKNGLSSPTVLAIHVAQNGALWLGTGKGVSILQKQNNAPPRTITRFDTLRISSAVYAIFTDIPFRVKDCNTSSGGFLTVQRVATTRIRPTESWFYHPKGNNSGNIWIDGDGGLQCFDGVNMRSLVKKDGLSDDRITSITQDF